MQVLFHTQIEKGPPTVERDEGPVFGKFSLILFVM